MIDIAFFEKDMVNQIVDDGDSIYIICDMDEKRIIRYCSPNVSKMGYNYRSLKSGTHSVDELIAPGELEHFIGNIHLADIEGKERTEILSGYNFLKNDGSTSKMNVKNLTTADTSLFMKSVRESRTYVMTSTANTANMMRYQYSGVAFGSALPKMYS